MFSSSHGPSVTAIKLSLGTYPLGMDRAFCAPSPQPIPSSV